MPDDASAPFLREAHNADRKWRKENILPENLGATEIIEGSGYTVLTDAINRTDADLLSAGAHARTGLATRLLGSFTSGLLHDPPTDLIVACTD
jgi:nucleotide-binding universal stress UspA family protein